MLSAKTLRLFRFIIRAASFGGLSPFKWCKKTDSLIVTQQSRYWFLLNILGFHFYICYLVLIVGMELLAKKPNLSSLPLAFGTLMITICTLVLIHNMRSLEGTMMGYINSFLYFCKYFKRRYMLYQRDEERNGCELLMEIACCGIILFPIGYGAYFIANPYDKIFLTSPFVTHPTLFRVLLFIFVPSCMTCCVGVTGLFSFYMISLTLPLYVSTAIGKEILPKKRSEERYKTHPHLRKPFNIICVYKTITIFNIDTNIISDSIMLLTQNILSYCIVICNFCLSNFYSGLDIRAVLIIGGLNISCLVVWMTSLWFGGISFKISSGKLRVLRRHLWVTDTREMKYFKKALKALRPIHLSFGSFYVTRMLSGLKFLNFVIWATTKALMMFKGYLINDAN
ncbi:unnamed protein product [Orchesella dallaii]|uniref:Odorant receptor n=1 Tax=Orchesella dallaii TaxID=48710 RepID=A0ABP1R491_9HEXA